MAHAVNAVLMGRGQLPGVLAGGGKLSVAPAGALAGGGKLIGSGGWQHGLGDRWKPQ